MKIRKAQMAGINATRRDAYHRRLLSFYRETIPEETARFSDDALLKIIADGHTKAETYGVESGEALAQFIGMMILISPNFDDHPTVRHYLLMPDLDADLKVSLLSDLISRELRSVKN